MGTYPHSSCPYGMQLCIVISDLWRHHAHIRCQSARYFPQLSSSTQVKHRTAQQFAVSSRWRHWKPEEKPFQWGNLQTILIVQVNIPSWGQLGCTWVPRPFLLTAKGLVLRLVEGVAILYCLAILGDEIAMRGMHIDWNPSEYHVKSNKPVMSVMLHPLTFIMKISRSGSIIGSIMFRP